MIDTEIGDQGTSGLNSAEECVRTVQTSALDSRMQTRREENDTQNAFDDY